MLHLEKISSSPAQFKSPAVRFMLCIEKHTSHSCSCGLSEQHKHSGVIMNGLPFKRELLNDEEGDICLGDVGRGRGREERLWWLVMEV